MLNELVNLEELEALARARMERASFDYYAGAAGDEQTLAANRSAFDAIRLRPRVLVDVSRIETQTTVLGTPLAFPVMLAPAAFNRLAHPDGELAAARAAGRAGTVMVVSTMATCSLEEIADAATGPLWFQLYICRDRDLTCELVDRATAAGYRALVLTVDTPMLGRRERDLRNRFTLPAGLTIRNLEVAGRTEDALWSGDSSFFAHAHRLFDPGVTWEAVAWLRSLTPLPIVLKGILTAEDARRAADTGVDALVVSNHGGRQLDGAVAAIAALPEVIEAVGVRLPVLVDGGVRRGTDVLKALALGAEAALIGRPYLWGLAVAGEAGVARVLEMLKQELTLAMGLSGRPSVAAIDRTLVSYDLR